MTNKGWYKNLSPLMDVVDVWMFLWLGVLGKEGTNEACIIEQCGSTQHEIHCDMIDQFVCRLNAMGCLIKTIHDSSNSSMVTMINTHLNDIAEELHYRVLCEHFANFTELSDKLMGKGNTL